MLDVTFARWAVTIGLIVALFVLDLFVSRPGHEHEAGFREAVSASLFYVAVALSFGPCKRPSLAVSCPRSRSSSTASWSSRRSATAETSLCR